MITQTDSSSVHRIMNGRFFVKHHNTIISYCITIIIPIYKFQMLILILIIISNNNNKNKIRLKLQKIYGNIIPGVKTLQNW